MSAKSFEISSHPWLAEPPAPHRLGQLLSRDAHSRVLAASTAYSSYKRSMSVSLVRRGSSYSPRKSPRSTRSLKRGEFPLGLLKVGDAALWVPWGGWKEG